MSEELVGLEVLWSNCDPLPMVPEAVAPCVLVDGDIAPSVTIWDWATVPDALSVALVVHALEVLGTGKDEIPPHASWSDLVSLLGPDFRGVIDAETVEA